MHAAAAAKSLQSCPTLCNPIDGSRPGSPVPGLLQARTLEWVAISFSNAWQWKVKVKSLSHVRLLATPWTSAYQAPPSMGFSRQEYWSGVPSPSPTPMHRAHSILYVSTNLQIFCWHPFKWTVTFIKDGENILRSLNVRTYTFPLPSTFSSGSSRFQEGPTMWGRRVWPERK